MLESSIVPGQRSHQDESKGGGVDQVHSVDKQHDRRSLFHVVREAVHDKALV